MQVISLTDTFAVAGQILPSEMGEIAAAGYKVLINNRPDGEAPEQPPEAVIRAAAEEAGLEYHYMPVNALNFPGEQPELYAALANDAERPALAFCRTGTRCTNLWITTGPAAERDARIAHGRALGFDLKLALSC